MPPGYIDTSLPVREPSGMNSQEFDIDDRDFRTGRTKPGCRDDAVSGVLVRRDLIGLVSLELRHCAWRDTLRVRRDPNRRGVDDDMKTEVRFSFAGSKPGQLSATFASW